MKETLNTIAEIIEDYKNTDVFDGVTLNKQLKELTARLYYLETVRAKYHDDFENIIHNKVKEGSSVSRATNEANVQVPEMYKLRRLLESAYRVSDAMRTNISFLKSEIHSTQKNY